MCSRLKKIKTLFIKKEAKKVKGNIDIIYNIKSKDIYDTSIKKVNKWKSENISDEESDNNKEIDKNIFPSSGYRYPSKKLPKDIDNLSQLPE